MPKPKTMKYTKYEKYKDSGIAWLGEIPEHWEEVKPKHIGYLYGGLSGKSGNDFHTEKVQNSKPFIPFTNIANNNSIKNGDFGFVEITENESQNEVMEGDIFFLMSSENYDDIGKTSVLKENIGEVYLNSFCKGFRIMNEFFDSIFLNYLFRADVNRKQLILQARGFTRINLKIGKVNNLRLFAPLNKQEQTTIANFLDYKTEKINRFITKKRQLIELLKEQKEAIINQAVTKGINPNVPMKDSGIEWLGEIPEHWEVRKLKYVAKILNGKDCDKKDTGKYPVYGSGGIFGWYDDFLYDKPSVLLGRKGTIDKPQYVTEPFWSVDTAFYTKINEDVVSPLFFYFLCCNIPFGFYSSKTALPSMTQTELYKVKFAIPSKQEQKQIVNYIENETKKIDKTISTIQKEIALVEEYKTALIAEAVTGKIDVRGFEC